MSERMEADTGRNWMVIGALGLVLLVAIGFVVWTYLNDGRSAPLESVVTVSSKGQGVDTKESEHYQKVLKEYNQGNAAEAGNTGSTYVSVFSTREEPVVQSLPPQAPQDFPPPAQQVQYPGNPPGGHPSPPEQPISEAEQQRQQRIAEQVGALLANWSAAPHAMSTVAEGYTGYAQSVNARPAASDRETSRPAASVAGKDQPVFKVLPDYARLAGLLETNIDTDENSDVVAFVPSGPYKGLKVYASGYKRINETVDMTFNAMVWQGKTYKITAKAVDKDTLRTSLSGDVNNRYFERIVLPAIAAGIGSTGKLYEQSSSQNIITPQGGVIQTYPQTPNSTAVIGSMIGGAGEQAGKVLAADAAQIPPKQVLIPSMTTIGIQFIGPVLSSDEVAPGSQAEVPTVSPSGISEVPQPASYHLQLK